MLAERSSKTSVRVVKSRVRVAQQPAHCCLRVERELTGSGAHRAEWSVSEGQSSRPARVIGRELTQSSSGGGQFQAKQQRPAPAVSQPVKRLGGHRSSLPVRRDIVGPAAEVRSVEVTAAPSLTKSRPRSLKSRATAAARAASRAMAVALGKFLSQAGCSSPSGPRRPVESVSQLKA